MFFHFNSALSQSLVSEKKNPIGVYTDAELLYQQNKLDEALELFLSIENNDSLIAVVNYRLACIYQFKKEFEKSKYAINKALNSAANKTEFLTKKAEILEQNFELKESLNIRKQLVELFPRYPSRYEDLLKNLLQVSEFQQVLFYSRIYEKQFGLNPYVGRIYEYTYQATNQFDSLIAVKKRFYLKYPEDFQNFKAYHSALYKYYPEKSKFELKDLIKNDSLNQSALELYIKTISTEYFAADSIQQKKIYTENKNILLKSIQPSLNEKPFKTFSGIEVIIKNETDKETIRLIYDNIKKNIKQQPEHSEIKKLFWLKFYSIEDYSIAAEILEELKMKYPENLDNYYYLVRCYYELNEHNKLEILNSELQENFPFLEGSQRIISGIKLQTMGKYKEANLIFEKESNFIKPWNKIVGDNYFKLGNSQLALKFYKIALLETDINQSTFISLSKTLNSIK